MTIRQLPDNLELLAKQVVEGFIIGLHKSPFHGFSVEFAEHRLYNPGDVLRHIDWRVFGRTNKLFVKKYEEETNLRCCMAIDLSPSMYFPDRPDQLNKAQFAMISAATLLQLLKKQMDAASLCFFDDQIRFFSECRSSHTHYRNLMTELDRRLRIPPAERSGSEVAAALHRIAEQIHKRSLVIIFSDMIDDAMDAESLFAALQHLKYNKHEVILFHVVDGKQEMQFEFENRPYEFVDMETGDKIRLQPQQVKNQYIKGMSDFTLEIANRCHQYHIDYVPVDLSQSVEQVLYSFLLKRNKLL